VQLAHDLGLVPIRTADPAVARAAVREHGAAVLTGCDTSETGARSLPTLVFGSTLLAVPEAAEVREGGVHDPRPEYLNHTTPLPAHTDGFAYGDRYPDHFLLVCVADSEVGGESFLIDGYAVLDRLADDPSTAWVPGALEDVVIEQTQPGKRSAVSPVVQRARDGRLMVRRFPHQRPRPDSRDPVSDQRMIDLWAGPSSTPRQRAPRFKLAPGDAVIIDNYRMLHGRDAYADLRRHMWRVWCWTDRCRGVPDGRLHSDSRHAGAES
jgi:gamma-butyrobetaine dioxygenase